MRLELGWGFAPAVLAWDGNLREGAAFIDGRPCHILALDSQVAPTREYRITPISAEVLGLMRNASDLRDRLSFFAISTENEVPVPPVAMAEWKAELDRLLAAIHTAVREAEGQATTDYLEVRTSPGRARRAGGPDEGGV
jgi:hypothetical protein